MPKRVRKKAKRRELAKEVMVGGGAGNLCTRLPRNPVIDARMAKEMKGVVPRRYVDIDELKKETGSLTRHHFEMMETSEESRAELLQMCTLLQGAFSSAIVKRVEAHDEGTVFSAITDRWLCVRAARLCKPDEVSGDEDEEDEE